jgi:hypothetical protein
MINASQEFKNLINKGVKIVNYADITLRNGTVLNLEPSDFSVGGFSMTDKTSNGKFEIGTAIAKTISATIANHTNKFSAYDFYKSIIYMYVAVEKEDGTVLKERKGKYYVINPVTPNDTIKLSGVDSMCLFDKPYNANTAFPATLQTILSDCCLDCGVNIGFEEFDNWNFVVMNKPENCTYRQVVSWVAQIAGCHARINNNDYLELVWYDTSSLEKVNIDGGNYFVYENDNIIDGGDFTTYESDLIIDGGSFTDYSPPNITKIKPPTVSTDNVIITGVKVEYNKKEVVSGTEDYLIIVKDNPFVDGKENEVCQYLADRMIGLSFRPLSCQMVNNPLFEPFDSCYVYDRKGNAYFTLINSVTYTISGFTTLSCNADDPVRNESSYVSESAKAIVQAKRETANQLTLYDKAVQNMNLLAANSMGLYRESEIQSDGSFIYYMSNRPIVKNNDGICEFELNSVVYKMTGDGFFVSTDGGVTYTSGFDSEGNAIVNVLSAIGITFDWARGGTLSLGGDNNINGEMVVYDAENNIVGRFNKDGLWAENGYFKGTIESKDATITGGQVKIETSVANYDFISLKHGTNKTFLSPDYLKLEDGSYSNQIVSNQISISYGTKKCYLKSDGLLTSYGSYTTSINADNAIFGKDVSITNDLYLFGKFALDLDTLGNISCAKKGDFGTGLSVANTLFTVSANGSVYIGGNLESNAASDVNLKGDCQFGSSYSKVGFFGNSGSSKKSVSTIISTSTASSSSNATKINEIINALKAYNLL